MNADKRRWTELNANFWMALEYDALTRREAAQEKPFWQDVHGLIAVLALSAFIGVHLRFPSFLAYPQVTK
jgi:hypothetical protein